MKVTIEPERSSDVAAVRAVHLAAFPTPAEAGLVDRLRAGGHAVLSLVARVGEVAAGHVLFSPVTIERDGAVVGRGVGLAPVAVLPAYQNQRIGSALVRAGLDQCRAAGEAWCVVLGAPAYYARFGFQRASDAGIANEYGVDDEFMIVALAGELPRGGGLARYGDAFRTW